MQVFAAQNLAVLMVVLLAVALPSAAGQLMYNASWAIEAGSPACPNITACTGYSSVIGCSAPSYVAPSGGNPPFNFTYNNYTQLAAVPFRVRDGYTFEVSGLSFHMGLASAVGPNVSVYFYAANTTNASLPGVPLPGWATGKIFQSTIQYYLKQIPSPGNPVYRIAVSIPPFNLTQGLYYASIVTWGYPASTLYGQNWIDGYPQPGAYWSTFHGYSNGAKGQYPPNQAIYANWRWDVIGPTSNVTLCLWPTGRLWNQLGGAVTTPTPTPSVWVRYPLTTDLNELVPSEFAVSVSDYFQLAPDTQVQVIRAVRAQVVPVEDPVSESPQPQPSPTAGTVVDFAVVANGTASYDLMTRVANVTSLHELRVWNVSIAASPTLVPVYNVTL